MAVKFNLVSVSQADEMARPPPSAIPLGSVPHWQCSAAAAPAGIPGGDSSLSCQCSHRDTVCNLTRSRLGTLAVARAPAGSLSAAPAGSLAAPAAQCRARAAFVVRLSGLVELECPGMPVTRTMGLCMITKAEGPGVGLDVRSMCRTAVAAYWLFRVSRSLAKANLRRGRVS